MLDGVRWFVLVTRVVLLLGGGSGAPLTISITIGGCGDADPTTWLRGRARYTRRYKARRFDDDDDHHHHHHHHHLNGLLIKPPTEAGLWAVGTV